MPLMVDLFSGLGGASEAMRERGWEVVRVDIDPGCNPDLVMDVKNFIDYWKSHDGRSPDLLWASPPCDEFSRAEKPWYGFPVPSQESLELVKIVFDIVREIQPKFWILENVRGAQKWLGKAPYHCGAFYLWGHFPFHRLNLPHSIGYFKEKLFPSPQRKALRAKVPYELSLAVALVVEEELSGRGDLFGQVAVKGIG